ncbi:MAG TPA: DMT family transporter [Solimonas sp.]|nr:DMT family transporter [Solimonas sp.]
MTLGPGEIYSITCALAWGTAVVLLKKSGESLAPFALNLFKNTMVLPLFLLTILIVEGTQLPPIPPAHLALILLSGFLGIAAGDTLYLGALNTIGASRMAVAQTLYSPFVIGLSILFLAERLRLWQFAGVALVLAGIVLVTWVRGAERALDHDAIVRGALGAVFSVFLMAIGVVIAKPMLEQYSFLWVVTLRVAGGLGGMLLIVALQRRVPELRAAYRGVRHWPQVIAGGLIATYISMMLWLAGYKYTKASVAAVLNELAAVFILVLAVIFLRERVTRRQLAGTALALAGVVLVVSA